MDINGVVSALIGGIFTLIGGFFAYRIEEIRRTRHAASVLYYDLKSIEDYIKSNNNIVDIRYFEAWQTMTAECTFLDADNVKLLYKIYDLVYDYDYSYRGREKDDEVPQYEKLKR